MKNAFLIALAVMLGVTVAAHAQNTDDGASAGWNEIDNGFISRSDSQSVSGIGYIDAIELSNAFASDTGRPYSAQAMAQTTNNTELKAFARSEIFGSPNALAATDRINVQASAFIGEIWGTASATLAPGAAFAATADVAWDGRMAISVPAHGDLNTYFNEVAVQVDFTMYRVPANPNDEPESVLGYVSGPLKLRADDKSSDFATFTDNVSNFYTGVDDYVNATTFFLTLNATPVASGPDEYIYDITLGGSIPFTAFVGDEYIVNYGLSVYSNVTGAAGYAEADFFNTGTIGLSSGNPSAEFAIVPEPTTLMLLLPAIGYALTRRRAHG